VSPSARSGICCCSTVWYHYQLFALSSVGDSRVTEFMIVTKLIMTTVLTTATNPYAVTAFDVVDISAAAALTSTSPQVGHRFTPTLTQILNIPGPFKYLSLLHLAGRLLRTISSNSPLLCSAPEAGSASVGVTFEAEPVGSSVMLRVAMVEDMTL
jgi:hypothetical protein